MAQSETQSAPINVWGGRKLLEILVLGFVGAFIAVYADFIWEIWRARANGSPSPEFSEGLVSFAGGLAGILGSAFAVAFSRPDQEERTETANAESRESRIWRRISGLSFCVTVGIWAYAVVGGAAAVTALVNLDETPDPIKALSSVFIGYGLALSSTVFRSTRAS